MRSMTGFGSASGEVNGRRCSVEIRSFNHRFLDLKLRLPALWADPLLEQLVGQALRKRIHRGSLIVTVREEGRAGARPQVQIDLEMARGYGAALVSIYRELAGKTHSSEPTLDFAGLEASLQSTLVGLVAAQPGVVSLGEAGETVESRFQALTPILDAAVSGLLSTRQREADALAVDLQQRLGILRRLLDEVAKIAEHAPDLHRRKLSERLHRLIDGNVPITVDPQRLVQEAALIADRMDVSEEITRLRTHLAEFARLCQAEAVAGRQLDFLTQELNREVNTIGSKAQSAEIAARIVAMKAELERLREQIQNVE